MTAPLLPALPGYDNPELIAHGTTALVFRAVQTTLNRLVAIKVITVDTSSVPVNAARELATTVALSSQPHIVSIIDTGVTDDDRPYIVMEYCEGGSYAGILRQHGPLPLDDVLEVGVKIGEALHAAHQVGIVHRDVKPSNILRSRFGPALTDFGIARAPDELGNTLTRELMTPHHASPEALLHQAQSGISDVYSLASTMWTLLVGHPPFVDPRHPTMDMYAFRDRVLHDELPPMTRAGVPPWLLAELRKAMAKLPAARHHSAQDFAESLHRGSLGLASASASTPLRVEPASPSPPGSTSPASDPTSPASPSPASSRLIDAANAAGSLSLGLPSALGQPSTFVAPPSSPVPLPYVPPAPVSGTPVGSGTVAPSPWVAPGPDPADPAPASASGPWTSAPTAPAQRGATASEPPEAGGATTGGSTGRPATPSRAPIIPPLPPGHQARPVQPIPTSAPPVPSAYAGPPAPAPRPPSAPDRGPAPAGPSLPRPGPPAPGPGRPLAPGPPQHWPGPTSSLTVGGAAPVGPPDLLESSWPPPPPGSTTGDQGGWLGSQPRPRPAPPRPDSSTLVAPPRSRSTLLAVLIAFTVVAIVGAGILLAANRNRAATPSPTTADSASPQATRFITATKEDAPRNVKIVDQRGTTLTVTWTDPTDGTVSFVVNGLGPNDEKLDAKFVDRGVTSVAFVGLSPTRNYCFLVAAVYSASHVAVADQTCTKR